MRRSILAVSLLAATAIGGLTYAQSAPSKGPELGSFGFDETGIDTSTAPGDDFGKYAGGAGRPRTEIPADKATYGMFNALADRSLEADADDP